MGMKPMIGKGMHPLPNPRPRKQLRFACCGRSFRPEGRGLNQQGKLIKLGFWRKSPGIWL
jgi:hypothetical protein